MLQNLSYAYDANGNLKTATDLLNSANNQSYAYDPLNRLNGVSGANNFVYNYDAVGNRTLDSKNQASTDYQYDPGSQKLLSQTGARPDTITTDAAGNITNQAGGKLFVYDHDQHLGGARSSANQALTNYAYNTQGQRFRKANGITNPTYFDYDLQGQLLNENGPSLQANYVYLDGQPLARIDYNFSDATYNVNTWNLAYYHNNPVGAPTLATDRNAQIAWTGQMDPFGKVLPINPNITQNLRFPGQYFDAETGLHYNGHRYYDPEKGRYPQSDLIGLAGGINTYAYVANNPLRYTDPLGLTPNPLETACVAGPNPVCDAGIAVDIATTLLGGAMIADSINDQSLSDKVAKAKERKEYSSICKTPIPPTGDKCVDAKANLNRLEQCLNLREDFGRKWYGDNDPGHEIKNQEIRAAINSLQQWIKANCGNKCK